MGVRFQCPAGHELHVKAHLSGKRGICPQCGAKFIVPSFSGGRVSEAADAPAAASNGNGASAPEDATWYVRPPSGGQFGPVATDVFDQWVAEGRVSADSWVWRSGWPDWKSGREALGGKRVDSVAIETFDSGVELEDAAPLMRTLADVPAPKPGEAMSMARRRRQQLNHQLTLILGMVALVLVITLAVVLSR